MLTVNAGSSSLKLRLLGEDDELLFSSSLETAGDGAALSSWLASVLGPLEFEAVGHRVVHGGPAHEGPALLDPRLEAELERLAELAPLHNSPALAALRAIERLRPGLPQVACFDTAFHATIPAAAATYAVPAAWRRRWPLRRFGFHGLSHRYASRRAAELLGRPLSRLRLVTAHLGAGASLAAIDGGRSVDTTMGFTPLEGLVMATRAGSVDPGLLLWVQRHGGLTAEEMELALERESGLLALAGTADMRAVLAGAEAGEEPCRLAFDAYVHRLAAGIAAMAAALGGLDGLVFTGGVGEGSAAVREAAARDTAFLGVRLDAERNAGARGDAVLAAGEPGAAAVLVEAREDLEIAAEVRSLLAAAGGVRISPDAERPGPVQA
ncbi:MAG: acetate/propionate family kinase [Solirubrobacterales bacterium]